MTSDKQGIENIVEVCVRKGLDTVIISPGSRNAPLIVAFNRHPAIQCLSIVDERSAAFFALGVSREKGKVVGLVSTSGTAVLNYAPALAEAYYQNIPLLVFTADRPAEWVDQGESQVIRQNNVFANFIRKSFTLPSVLQDQDDRWYQERLISEAFLAACGIHSGPVHINVPLKEPLYRLKERALNNPKFIERFEPIKYISEDDLNKLKSKWQSSSKKMILCGVLPEDKKLNQVLVELSNDPSVIVLCESTSNLHSHRFVSCIDRTLAGIHDREETFFSPDIILTIGTRLVSKMIKAFLRKFPETDHWHLDPAGKVLDTFKSLRLIIPAHPLTFLERFQQNYISHPSVYQDHWLEKQSTTGSVHLKYLKSKEFCDLKIFEFLNKALSENISLHLGNSTPIRYIQLFDRKKGISHFANRGTSGIDGCTSTAAGAAWISKRPVLLITGDLSFFYDSNALWNNYIGPELKIFVINNGGGGIFRFIEGPSKLPELEDYFETRQNFSAKGIAETFGLAYFSARNPHELESQFKIFIDENERSALFEVFTPNEYNGQVLKEYFQTIKKETPCVNGKK